MLFVTGITGHSGKWFLKRLEEERYPGPICCVMKNSREDAPEKYKLFDGCNLDIRFAIGDLGDSTFLSGALKGAETVVHTASISHSPELVNTSIENGVKWVILVHTTGRYSKYKSASEGYIKIEDEILNKTIYNDEGKQILNCTVVRPTMIYGSSSDKNMYRLIGYLYRHRLFPVFGDGSNLMQPVHARDLGNAYYDILLNPEKTMNKQYNLSGREPQKYIEIIKTISRALNRRVLIVKVPISLSIFAAKVYNALFKSAIITVEQVMRMQEDKAFSYEEAASDFGYDPLSFEEGIKGEVHEYLSGKRVDYKDVRY